MIKKAVLAYLCLCLSLWSAQTFACFAHMYMGGGPEGSMAEMASAKRVFKLQHPQVINVPVGKESGVVIKFKRPRSSSNVRVELTNFSHLTLIDKELELTDFEGSVRARFVPTSERLTAIELTVSGEYEGQAVRESSTIYVLGKKTPTTKDRQVTSR